MGSVASYLAYGGVLLTKVNETNVFKEVLNPVINLVNQAVGPLLALVAALGAVYCILLGAKLAKAEEPQDREKAKAALKNALIGFLLIFILLAALKIAMPIMETWYQNQGAK